MINILVVDDEKIERNGIKFLLKKMGLEAKVSEAVNGVKALEMLEKEHIDILVTDIKMPFMDGIELIQEVVKKWKDLKIVIFSGYGEFEYARLAMKFGVSNYILKPVDPDEFKTTMEKVIREIEDVRINRELTEKEHNFVCEHLLLSVIMGNSPDSLEREEVWKDNIEFNYHYMMLLEFKRDFFSTKESLFNQDLENILEHDYKYLNINPQQCVIVFRDDDLDRVKTAQKISDMVFEKYKEECYIAVSERFEGEEELSKVYDSLESLMENRFYMLEDKIFLQNDTGEDSNFEQIEDDKLMKKIKQDIKLKDMVGLREHFEQLCEKYKSKKNFSQVYVKFIFSNLLKDIYETLPKNGENSLNEDIDKLYRAADFKEVIDILEKGIQSMEKSFSANPQMLHREIETVKQYIYANYDKELSVDMLAEKVFMAPSYLSHIFKKETGQNLSKFIKSLRMEKAKEMLEESHNKIVNISYAVGYPNVSYFCQSFREYFGVSPQKYRNQGDTDENNSKEI